ncbi:MAG TPA: type IV pilus secretin PilQ [Candidatus Acidoferrum sp.]|jgi:type IV pilus assembly protein PilQ|nr:type IV pilus secretin PilQ [Candidatus Acidoferrum sp.]
MMTNRPAFRIGCLTIAAAALSVSPSFAQTQEPGGASATASVISSVAVTAASQRESVRVEGQGPLEVHASRAQNPERLVLDFSSARLATQKATMPGVSAPVRGVRLGQYRPDVARIVVDLTSAAPYQILREGPAVVVAFDLLPEPPVDSSVTTTTVSNSSRRSLQYSDSTPHVVRAVEKVPYRAPRFALPGELTQPSVVLASFSENTKKDEPVRPIAAQEAAAQATAQAGNAAATVAPQTAASPSRYSGEPISVNLKDVDLRDFFRLIHEISGLNVVLDPNVKGTLTIVLDEVPWDQALDIVLQNNGLEKQLHGNVLRVATLDTIKKEAETARDVRKAENDAQEMVTVTRVLSYAKAEQMTPTLKKFLTGRGDILFDARSNQLIIRDIPSVIPNIDNLLRQLDRKSQQVEIEARVVAATRAFAQDIGTELGFAATTTSGRSFYSGSPAVGGSGVTTTGVPNSPVSVGTGETTGNGATNGIPLNVNLGASAPTSGFGFSNRSPNFAIDFFITAAESKGVGKLLSKPRIVTQNNEKATVKQGVKIPIQTTINNTISVQYVDAVLQLQVTPQITADGTVFMDVVVENTQIDQGIPRIQGVPALDTESAESKVTVADGATIVVGGVIVTSSQVNITQVPLLGSIPIIGNLFKRNATSVNSSELLFFLTPRIIPSA